MLPLGATLLLIPDTWQRPNIAGHDRLYGCELRKMKKAHINTPS